LIFSWLVHKHRAFQRTREQKPATGFSFQCIKSSVQWLRPETTETTAKMANA